ncbi:MAG: insulinase family protein [Acidobacteriia bacterium]|nr:insulinase family protein [Terriglobia bacterium]
MKKILKLIALSGLALVLSLAGLAQEKAAAPPQKQTPPAGGPPKAFTVPQKQTFTLPNGLQVTMVPYGTLPKVAILATVRAGSLNEAADQVWLSDFTGRLIKEGGTKSRSAEQVAQESASMGGSINIGTGYDQTQVFADVLSEFGPKMVGLLADVIQHPLLPESEFPRLKQDALRRLAITKSQSQPLASEHFMKALYPDHPYGRSFPTEEIIGKLTVADAQKFYKDNFGAARTHVYVAGKFDAAAMKKAITDSFSAWAKGPDPMINIPKPVAKRTLEVVDRPNAAQSTVYVGLPTIDPSNPDYIALQVTNAILGGSFGSRITSNIREQKGYTYSPFSTVSTRYRDAYWAEFADVTTAVTGPSLKEIFFEIDRLQKEPPSPDELKGIQDYMGGIFVLQNSSRLGIIGQLVFIDLHNLGDKYLETYVQKVFAVTTQQVQQMTQKYLTPDKMTIVVVGDKSKITEQLAPYQPSGQ